MCSKGKFDSEPFGKLRGSRAETTHLGGNIRCMQTRVKIHYQAWGLGDSWLRNMTDFVLFFFPFLANVLFLAQLFQQSLFHSTLFFNPLYFFKDFSLYHLTLLHVPEMNKNTMVD